MFDVTRQYLQKLGFPGEDLWHLPTSEITFSDDANFRTVNRHYPEAIQSERGFCDRNYNTGVPAFEPIANMIAS